MFATTEPGRSSRRRIPLAIAALLAIGLVAAACGSATAEQAPSVAALPADSEESASAADGADDAGDGERAPVNPEDVSPEEAEAAQLKFDQCMTDNGVDQDELFGDIEGEGGGAVVLDSTGEGFDAQFEAYEAALEECEPILEGVFGDFTLSPEQEAEMADAEAAFNQCAADAGFEIGEGSADGGFQIDADVDIDELREVLDECAKVYENLDSIQFGGPEGGESADRGSEDE